MRVWSRANSFATEHEYTPASAGLTSTMRSVHMPSVSLTRIRSPASAATGRPSRCQSTAKRGFQLVSLSCVSMINDQNSQQHLVTNLPEGRGLPDTEHFNSTSSPAATSYSAGSGSTKCAGPAVELNVVCVNTHTVCNMKIDKFESLQ